MGDTNCSGCCNLINNETVTCRENMTCTPCACLNITSYLRMEDINNVQAQCSQQLCTVSCDEGYVGDDVPYMCNSSSNCIPTSGQAIMCERGLFVLNVMLLVVTSQP